MAFYADQADGFAPALELIHQVTGLNRKDISAIRKQLVDNGFIAYMPNKTVTLDWDRIRLYSTLDKDMLPSKRGKATIAPVASIPNNVIAKIQPTIKQLLWKYKYTDTAPVRELTQGEKEFYKFVEGLTEEEARLLFNGAEPLPLDQQPHPTFGLSNSEWLNPAEERLSHSRDSLPF